MVLPFLETGVSKLIPKSDAPRISLPFEPRRVAVAHPHVHHRTEAVAERGRERPGVEVDRTQQVGVDQRGVAARSALHGEVVQHRDFDAVEVIFVFVGPAAAYEHVVALDGRGDDPGGLIAPLSRYRGSRRASYRSLRFRSAASTRGFGRRRERRNRHDDFRQRYLHRVEGRCLPRRCPMP